MPIHKAFLVFISLVTFTSTIIAQGNNPYSRYGIGQVQDQDFVDSKSMGGLSAAFSSPISFSASNPASLSFLRYTTLSAGGFAGFSTYKTDAISDNSGEGGLSYLNLAFPIKANRWGLSLGLKPFSKIGYDIVVDQTHPDFGGYQDLYKGDGSLYNFSVGTGYNYKNFAIGVNIGYLFGKLDNVKANDLLIDNEFNTRVTESFSYSGFKINTGLQYNNVFNDKWRVKVGYDVSLSSNIDKQGSLLYERVYGIGDLTPVLDTAYFSGDLKSNINLPITQNLGFSIGRENKWMVGMNYMMSNWNETGLTTSGSLSNNYRFSMGGEYTPNSRSIDSYLARVKYRAGMFYGTDALVINGENLKNYGINFGFGLPMKTKSVTGDIGLINLGFEFGKRGAIAESLIEENYFKVLLGINFSNRRWFIKRKFD